MSSSSIKAVLFDMDGTLVDTEPLWDISLAELASQLGGNLSAETRRKVVGCSLQDAVRIVQTDLRSDGEDDRWATWLLQRTTELFLDGVSWRPGARDLVQSIGDANIPMALVTSSYRVLTEAVLHQMERGLFEVIVCGDEVSCPKPDPESYLTAASRLGVDIHSCVTVEDSPRGIAAARAAGSKVVAVPEDADIRSSVRQAGVATYSLEEVTVRRLSEMMTAGNSGDGENKEHL